MRHWAKALGARLRRLGFVSGKWPGKFMTMLEFDWQEGGMRSLQFAFPPLEMRNCKFLPRTGGPAPGWVPKTQRKGFRGNSRAV